MRTPTVSAAGSLAFTTHALGMECPCGQNSVIESCQVVYRIRLSILTKTVCVNGGAIGHQFASDSS